MTAVVAEPELWPEDDIQGLHRLLAERGQAYDPFAMYDRDGRVVGAFTPEDVFESWVEEPAAVAERPEPVRPVNPFEDDPQEAERRAGSVRPGVRPDGSVPLFKQRRRRPEPDREPVPARPLAGNGIVAIRRWVAEVTRHYHPQQDRALIQYASWLALYVHLKTFLVEVTAQQLAENLGVNRQRFDKLPDRLIRDGFLIKEGRRRWLAVPDVSSAVDDEAPW